MDNGGDFNDISSTEDKKGGRIRSAASCKRFKEFIEKMGMAEIAFQGRPWTWANNLEDEGYIEVRLDRFFGVAGWWLDNDKIVVHHVERHSSDHCLLLLDTDPELRKRKHRFCFDKRWVTRPGVEDVVRDAWDQDCEGSPMFTVATKIKQCRLGLLKWSKQQQGNAAKRLKELKEEMDQMKEEGGRRNLDHWNSLRIQLHEAYQEEEVFWSQKARKQWLQAGDRNTKYFHAQLPNEGKPIRLECWRKRREESIGMKKKW